MNYKWMLMRSGLTENEAEDYMADRSDEEGDRLRDEETEKYFDYYDNREKVCLSKQ